jgi:hypothetical protein
MRKYFYTNGVDKTGPFSLEDLRRQSLTRETKVWYYGLDDWKKISEIEELKSLVQSMPPSLPFTDLNGIRDQNSSPTSIAQRNIEISATKTIKKIIIGSLIFCVSAFIFGAYLTLIPNQEEKKLYDTIAESAFETDVDFDFYIDKFYRDIAVYGIYPKKPKKIIIKFGGLDQIKNATHIHGLSYGLGNDDLIEIYINPSTWEKFNKPMRYWLIYHELSHDVLNVDDLEDLSKNRGKLMYPSISSYESIKMDDFIESSHALFEEVSGNKIF